MQFPKTLLEFQAQFPDEESCWASLRRVRWPRGFVCPRCQGRRSHFLATRRLEQCSGCRYQASVTAGTVLHGTRVSLRVWFLGAFFLGRHKKGISALQLRRWREDELFGFVLRRTAQGDPLPYHRLVAKSRR